MEKAGQIALTVALDFSDVAAAEKLIADLNGLPVIYKVGLELFMAAGPAWVKKLTDTGKRVFLDLKYHDIPNTVAQAVIQSCQLGVEFVTVHLFGGKRMLDEIQIRLEEARISGEVKTCPKILGVSVLTSFHEEDWIANVSHVARVTEVRSIEESVKRFADLAGNHPVIYGMVCSPKEIDAVRLKHPDLFLMVPGIRPKGSLSHDQSRVVTPEEVATMGANAIVMGRPITRAAEPRKVVEDVIKALQ